MTDLANNTRNPVPAAEPLDLRLSEGLGARSRSAQMGPLEYGNCQGLPMARNTADCARREDLRGMYPSACVVLDMHVARLEHAIRGMLATWDDESDVTPHERIAELRDVLNAPNARLRRDQQPAQADE